MLHYKYYLDNQDLIDEIYSGNALERELADRNGKGNQPVLNIRSKFFVAKLNC